MNKILCRLKVMEILPLETENLSRNLVSFYAMVCNSDKELRDTFNKKREIFNV